MSEELNLSGVILSALSHRNRFQYLWTITCADDMSSRVIQFDNVR